MSAVRSDWKCNGLVYALGCSVIILTLPVVMMVAITHAILFGRES